MRSFCLSLLCVVTLCCSASSSSIQLHTLRDDVNPHELGIVDAYRESVELEKEIAQMYREIRSAQLSRIQKQTLRKSLEQILLPLSDRMNPDGELLEQQAKDGNGLAAYRTALKRLMLENDAIVANAEELLSSLLPKREAVELKETSEIQEESVLSEAVVTEVQNFLGNTLKELAEAEEALESIPLDALDENFEQLQQSQELAQFAKERLSSSESAVGGESTETINATEALLAIIEALEAVSASDQEFKDGQLMDAQEYTERSMDYLEAAKGVVEQSLMRSVKASIASADLSDAEMIERQQALSELSQASVGKAVDLTNQMKGNLSNTKPKVMDSSELLKSIHESYRGIAGRKFHTEGGIPAVWYQVNKWYILGPYDNGGRINRQRVYPPESIVDLDANYLGDGNIILKWEYDSFTKEMVNPSTKWDEYSIYYGYTELFFEEAADLWIAVGSDDRSDLWINDMPVWQSSNQLKMWRVDEGLRKVHFREGVNRVLFRLENGWHSLGFSLLINTDQTR